MRFLGWAWPIWPSRPWAITITGFLTSVLYTDEINNLHNRHLWATILTIWSKHLISSGSASMCEQGFIGNCLLGPVLLPQCLNGEMYLAFLQNMLPPLLENVSLAIRQTMWLQHDGAPTHFRINVRRYLNIFPIHWIERGDPVAWPAWSPDLNPLDLYLWGHLKSIVYSEPVPDVQTQQHVHVACDYLDTAQNIQTSQAIHDATCALHPMEATSNICCDMDRIEAMYCVPELFDDVLHCHILWKLYISGHKVIWTFMLHFQSRITLWSLSVDLKLTLFTLYFNTTAFVTY